MPRTYDAIVIGSGFAGASTAYHLTQRGLRRLLIVEAEERAGVHASGRNASLAFQQLSDGAEARLAVEGRRFIAEPPAGFCGHPLLRDCGSLLLAREVGAPNLRRAAAEAAALGVESHALTPAEARARVPLLDRCDFAEARWTPSDGVVDIEALLRAYLDGAVRAGAEHRCSAPVGAVHSHAGRIQGVRAGGERYEAPLVVNAAGAWAGEIGVLAGVGPRTLVPRRRHMYRARVDFDIDPSWPFVWHDDIDVYFRPDRGELLMSPCDATPHPACAPEVDPAMESVLHDKLARAFPCLIGAQPTSSWACLRTFTRDERFLIGRDPDLDGLVWAAGLGGHGMTTSPIVGLLAATAALGGHDPRLAPFAPTRFAAEAPSDGG